MSKKKDPRSESGLDSDVSVGQQHDLAFEGRATRISDGLKKRQPSEILAAVDNPRTRACV